MSKSNQDRKRIGKTGWLPFWNGSKFNKRLVSKRVRQYNKTNGELVRGWQDDDAILFVDYSSNVYPQKNYKINFNAFDAQDSEEE